MSIRLVLVDDHPIVLQGLEHLFKRHADIDVLGCFQDADSALSAIHTTKPDVVVLDLRMPKASGIDLLRRIREEKIGCRTVLLTAAISESEVVEAIKHGVSGLVLKESPPETLVTCVRRVHAGEQWLDLETVTRAFRTALDKSSAEREVSQTLTPREIEIVRMVAEGRRNRAIAQKLSISEGTVKVHLHNIYEKLGVDGRLELVLCAQQKGLV
jgi:DNA-binding NarL/FixJ family response regulator